MCNDGFLIRVLRKLHFFNRFTNVFRALMSTSVCTSYAITSGHPAMQLDSTCISGFSSKVVSCLPPKFDPHRHY